MCEVLFEQLLVRHDRDLESNMNARICVKTRNRDPESGFEVSIRHSDART